MVNERATVMPKVKDRARELMPNFLARFMVNGHALR